MNILVLVKKELLKKFGFVQVFFTVKNSKYPFAYTFTGVLIKVDCVYYLSYIIYIHLFLKKGKSV